MTNLYLDQSILYAIVTCQKVSKLPFRINWHVILEEGCGESCESVKSLLGLRHDVQVEDVVYADFPFFTVRMLKGMTTKQNLKPKKPNIGLKIMPGSH